MIADPTLIFEELRPVLFGIAYRMVGTVVDAEDMVQDTYLRWRETAADTIQSPRAWLTAVITRLCINHLKLARVQREEYVGPWLPEPIVDEAGLDPAESAQLAETLSLGFLVLLENLTPTERAVFILREGFDLEFTDIAGIVEKSEANCRKILTRARKRIEERRPRFDAPGDAAERLVVPFMDAVRTGNLENLLATMAKDVVLVTDGGGKARALSRPVQGPEPIARLLIDIARQYGSNDEDRRAAIINGLPGLVVVEGGRVLRVMAFGIRDGLIQALFIITNPDKLLHVRPPKS